MKGQHAEGIFSHLLKRRTVAFAAVSVLGVGLWVSPAAHAGLTSGNFTMLYSGTAPFDGDNTAGNDSGGANTVIRSNDSVGYRFTYTTSGGDTNAKIVLTAPAGARWNYTPPGCSAGSSIVGDVLTCQLGSIPNPQAQSIDFEMNVGPRVNGVSVQPATVAFTSDQTPTPPAYIPPSTLTSSAAPRWDVVKQIAGYGSAFRMDSGPSGAPGFILPYTIIVRAQNYQSRGGTDSMKGLAPLGSTVTIADNLPTANALIMDYGNPYQTTACVNHANGFNQWANAIYDTGPVSSTNPGMVANGGTCAVTQAGSVATLTMTGVDSSLTHRPTLYGGNGMSLTDIRTTTVLSKNLFVWIPQNDVATSADFTNIVNTLPAATFTASDGQQTYTESDTANNSATYSLRNWIGGSIGKVNYVWIAGVGGAISAQDAAGGVPDGFADAVNTTVMGTRWRPGISLTNTSSLALPNAMICDYLDNARLDLIPTSPGVYVTASGVDGAGVAIPASDYVIEYGTGGALAPNGEWTSVGAGVTSAQAQARCNDPGVTWATDPATVAGGVAAVTRIRWRYTGNGGDFAPSAVMGLRYGVQLRSTWRYTTAVAEGAYAGTYAAGSSIAPDSSFYSPNPYRIYNFLGAAADGLSELRTEVNNGIRPPTVFNSVQKSTVNPANTSPDPVGLGQTVTYGLDVFSRNVGFLGTENLTVTDVLPPGLSYVPGSSAYVGNAVQTGTPDVNGNYGGLPGTLAGEPVVSAGAPGCAGCTTLVWTVNATQPAFAFYSGANGIVQLGQIQFNATVGVVPSGTQLLNAATIDSPNDFAGDCTFQGATIGFGGVGCQKAATKLVTVAAPPGFYLAKTTPVPTRPINSTMDFNLALTGIGGDVANARWIDILPYNGDAGIRGSTGSSFTGTAALALVNVPAGVTTTYTKLPPASLSADPTHASNVTPGVTWCASLSGGACPSSLAEVTGLRFEAAILTSGTVYNIGVTMQATGNGGGGRYINNFRATGTTGGSSPVLASQDARVDVASVSYTVTGTAGTGGAIGPGSQSVFDGNTATLAITPEAGYVVDEITTTCSGGSAIGTNYTTQPVHADCNVHVTFKKQDLAPVAVPTLNEYALVLLSLMVLAVGAGSVRRRDMRQRKG